MFLLLLIVIFFIAIYAYKKEQQKYDIDKIPGPVSLPLIGNTLSFGFSLKDHFDNFNDFHVKHGPIVKIWPIWISPLIIINDAELVATILSSVKCIEKPRGYSFLKHWLGTGLLTSTGLKWHQRRKLLTPAFHFKILEQFIGTFAIESEILLEKLSSMPENKSIDIYPIIKLCALDIICETAMDTSINAQSGVEIPYVTAVKEFLKLHHFKQFSVWKNFDCLYQFSNDLKESQKVLKTLHSFTNSIITKRKTELKLKKDAELINYLERKPKTAFLDLLIQASEDGRILSNEDIREEVDTFMFEGHDTITSALSFTLYEISRHPEVQEKIYQEIKYCFPEDKNEPITYSHLQDLRYLGMVIKEGLRLYPPVPLFSRLINEDIILGKYKVPKESSLIMNAFSLHRQPKYFPDPEKFDPERFSIENSKNFHSFCYIPFSGGPRNCIGQKFAMLEMKMVLAKIISKFYLLPAPEPEHNLQLYSDDIIKSLTGVHLQIKQR